MNNPNYNGVLKFTGSTSKIFEYGLHPSQYQIVNETHSCYAARGQDLSIIVIDSSSDNYSLLDIKKAKNELKSYLTLGDDWDGYSSPSPNKNLVEKAISLLMYIESNCSANKINTSLQLQSPVACLSPEFGPGFYWRRDSDILEVYADTQDTYFWVHGREGKILAGSDACKYFNIDIELLESILSFTK